jgi:hypothetical protein
VPQALKPAPMATTALAPSRWRRESIIFIPF